ncbi:MAG: hypothetical protein ACTHMM_16595 [Agriterribacter sp.]
MNASKPEIYDMQSLDLEIRRLKTRCSQIEVELDNNMDNLKENYGKMAFNSFIVNQVKNLPFIGAAAGGLLGSALIRNFIGGFIEKAFGRRMTVLERWIAKIFR